MPLKLLCVADTVSLGPSLGPASLALDLALCCVLTLSPASSVAVAASLHPASSPSLLPSWLYHPGLFRGQPCCSDISNQKEPSHCFLGGHTLYSLVKCWEEVTFISLLQRKEKGVFVFLHHSLPSLPVTPIETKVWVWVCVCAPKRAHLSHHSRGQVPSTQQHVVSVCASLSANPHIQASEWTSPQSEGSPRSLDLAFFERHVGLHSGFHPTLPGHRGFTKQGLFCRGNTPLVFCGAVPTCHHPQREAGDSQSPVNPLLSWFSFYGSKRKRETSRLAMEPPFFLSTSIWDSSSLDGSLGTSLLYSGNPVLPLSHLPSHVHTSHAQPPHKPRFPHLPPFLSPPVAGHLRARRKW